jgi:hypothetical protein
MLQTKEKLNFRNRKVRMIIAGYPGIGKTTLAESAPSPLLIDLDDGLDRVDAQYRKDRILVSSYEELISDLKNNDLSSYQTLIIDTGGRLFELIKPYVIKQDAKNGKRDGSLALAGYGAAAAVFKEFVELCRKLDKHLVIIFHAKEDKDGDSTKLRILIEGQMKDAIWQDMDLGGFVEMNGKNRTIGFSNCERYYAKGTHGVKGIYEVPELSKPSDQNNFLTKLFETYLNNLVGDSKVGKEDQKIYDEAVSLMPFIREANSLEHINKLLVRIREVKHALTSEKELKWALHNKAKEMGFKYESQTERYVSDNTIPA